MSAANSGPGTTGRIVALGELLVDLVPPTQGESLESTATFVKAAGGAPANVAAGAALLGANASFIGRVGDDAFGRFLVKTLAEVGVDVAAVRVDPTAQTMLAFVSLSEAGERDFAFYGRPAAHERLTPGDVDERLVSEAAILHFGSVGMIAEPSRSATLRAVDLAERHGSLISFDPNLRLSLWPSAAAARKAILEMLPRAHLVKLSEEELEFLGGGVVPQQAHPWSGDRSALNSLAGERTRLLLLTLGGRGARYLLRPAPLAADQGVRPEVSAAAGQPPSPPWLSGDVAGFAVETVDTTGAGDAFVAALLASIAAEPLTISDEEKLRASIVRANAFAALTTTRRGGIPAMPRPAELAAFLAKTRTAPLRAPLSNR